MNVMSDVKAEFIANQIVNNPTLTLAEHAQVINPAIIPSAQRQAVYNRLQNKKVKAKIAEKIAKVYNGDELKQLTAKTIDKITQFVDNTNLTLDNSTKVTKVLAQHKDFIELAGKQNGDYVTKQLNLTVVAQLQADQATPLSTQQLIDSITNRVRDTTQQGRGEA